MITLLTGKKGSGKTKHLIRLAHDAVEKTKGSVVSIEKGDTLTFDIDHRVRLVNIMEYAIDDFTGLYGFIAGLLAGNYDITDILVDSTLRIGGNSLELFAQFIKKIAVLAGNAHVDLTFSVSVDHDDIPASISGLVTNI